MKPGYRGRLAPSLTGFLHAGHAQTFLQAQKRAREAGGQLFLRMDDLDEARNRPEFAPAILEDLAWCGLRWEGEVMWQSARHRAGVYRAAWEKLRDSGWIYPCVCSRKAVLQAAGEAPTEDEEPSYPGTCRERAWNEMEMTKGVNWRFKVPNGVKVAFFDGKMGHLTAQGGKEIGDFVVWRKDGLPAYELAVVVDDTAMEITEVVRGEDLVRSTFRQLLVYRALGWEPPGFYHAPLVLDAEGRRLAKRRGSTTLRERRLAGEAPPRLAAG